MATSSYEPRLDGLRGLAAAAVVLFHGQLLPGGQAGVDVFFVLSGYLITGILLGELDRTGEIDLPGFFFRRARRLLPALFLVLAAYAALGPILVPRAAWRIPVDIPIAALYLTDFSEAIAPRYRPLSHTWSLAVEAQFYLLWPLAMTLLVRCRETALGWLLATWAVVSALRAGLFLSGAAFSVAYFSPLHGTGLLLGSALALSPRLPRLGPWPLIALIGLVMVPRNEITEAWTISAAEILACFVILAPPRILAWRPLVWLGVVSYSLYLWHVPVWQSLSGLSGPVKLGTMLAASIGLASFSYYGLERHFLAYSRRKIAKPSVTTP